MDRECPGRSILRERKVTQTDACPEQNAIGFPRRRCVDDRVDAIAEIEKIGIVPRAAREHVRSTVAFEKVIQAVAGPVDGPIPEEVQLFDISPQRPGNLAEHPVRSLIGLFHHHVVEAHPIVVVAQAPGQHVPRVVIFANEGIIQAIARPTDGEQALE